MNAHKRQIQATDAALRAFQAASQSPDNLLVRDLLAGLLAWVEETEGVVNFDTELAAARAIMWVSK